MNREGSQREGQSQQIPMRADSPATSSSASPHDSPYEHQTTMPMDPAAGSITNGSHRERGGRRKRPREDDEFSDVKFSPKRIALPKGLRNVSSACFSNVSLQLLDAALTSTHGALLKGQAVPGDFEIETRNLDHLDGKKLTKARKKLDQEIRRSSPLNIAPYLGNVLDDLHRDQGCSTDPMLFRRVFAFGSAEDSREDFSGDTQEDAGEYLRHLIAAVGEEHGFVNDVFRYEMAETVVCKASGCQYRNELSATSGTLLDVQIPAASNLAKQRRAETQGSPSTSLDPLVKTHFGSSTCEGSICEECKAKDTLVRETMMIGHPSHLLISINRTKFEQVGGRGGTSRRGAGPSATKDDTSVELNLGEIRIGEQGVYRIVALVKHSGARAGNGHYTAYRKMDEGSWAFLDDDKVKMVDERSLRDGVKGYSSVVLLQRQPERS